MKTREQWISDLEAAAARPFSGWDFSAIKDGYYEPSPAWDYRGKVSDFLKPCTRLLDMGTGGGEFLLSLGHSPALTSVTEGWEPNVQLCKKRLAPMGISVKRCGENGALPFADGSFDLVINRHEAYDLQEVLRVLLPGGFFLTQQVGGRNNEELRRVLMPHMQPAMPDFNLENQVPAFRAAGLRVMYRNQSFTKATFTDVGALCWFAAQLPWEFPGFSVAGCFEGLMQAAQIIKARGAFETTSHRFLIIGKKR